MGDIPAGAPAQDTEKMIALAATNTSPTSLHKLARRIDEIPLGARVVMTVTKNEAGVLFWTLTALGSVER